MKKAVLGVLSLLVATSALASSETLVCDQAYGGSNSGYVVKKLKLFFPAGTPGSSADLKVPGERGLRKLGCVVPAIEPRPIPTGDGFNPLAWCNDRVADGGYSISVKSGGLAGLTIATVGAKNFDGNQTVATLTCRTIAHQR